MMLDRYQKEFCNLGAERIRLLAPAGSGKTLSLLWRCKAIQEKNGNKPQRFLVVTFTRSARDELRERLKADPDLAFLQSHIQINTLNAFGNRYLRGQQTGLQLITRKDAYWVVNNLLRPVWSQNALMSGVLSSGASLNFLKTDIIDAFDVLKELGFRHDAKTLEKSVRKHLSWLEEVGLRRYYDRDVAEKFEKMKITTDAEGMEFFKFWAAAVDHMYQSNCISFSDQKYFAMRKLEGTSIAANQRFHHILVDEFQDVDPLDMNFIKVLTSIHKSTLTIVGDDDQAIFEWRGAVPKFILEPDTFLGGTYETCILGNNYRSPANVVRHSQKLIKNNTVRVKKSVKAKNRAEAEIVYREFENYEESCTFVMNLVREIHEDPQGRRIAIMGRKRAQIIPYQIMLASARIPFYAKEDLNVFLQESFESLRDILTLISRRDDSRRRSSEIIEDFMCLINKVKRHPLSKKDSGPLVTYLNNRKPKNLREALQAFWSFDGSLKGGVDKYSFYQPIALLLATQSPARTLAVLGSEFKGFAKDYGKAQSLEDIFYVDPPFLHLADYAQRYGKDYDAFLDDLEEAIAYLQVEPGVDTEEERDKDEEQPIHLMTALRAKGKEYHTVVVLDAIDGIWPSKLAYSEQEKEQERRLFYVAVTRTMSRLFIIANKTMLGAYTDRSPYIDEMGVR